MLEVEQWAELRRDHFVAGISIKELARRTGLDRNTVRRALRSSQPPRYQRASAGSKLDPFKAEIHRLLKADPSLPGTRVRELLDWTGGKTIVDDYLREVRPFFSPPRTYQRTRYRPGEICQFDLWQPTRPIPVGHGQTRVGYVVVAALGYSRVGAGALVFSKEAVDLLWGMSRCLAAFAGVPKTLVWDREGALHAGGGRPSDALAAFCGQLRCGWYLCEAGDAQAKGLVERLQGYLETSFEPGRLFANERDFQLQLDGWFANRANVRFHRGLGCRPLDRFVEERAGLAPPPAAWPESERRFVTRVPVDPYLRFDTNDYSLDPRLAARRVEVRISQREVRALALDSGELAARHERSFARHRTITALEHARALHELRGARRVGEPEVEQRSLSVYDQLLSA